MDSARIREHLQCGGVIAYPTESCYGLGCDPMNIQAIKRVLSLKKRSPSKGLILIAAYFQQLQPYLQALTPELVTRMNAHWPGPHTWLVPASATCPAALRGDHDTVAVRVTAHRDAAALCRAVDMALVSTSANLSGEKPAQTAEECRRLFGQHALIIPGEIGTCHHPSTIQDLMSGRIIRK
ncbi:MAG: Sua5/YciO/YrdC/YwlC family protein [Methylobacillus sp.]|jgi:L-threonylcarbamoyladenylate synthase|nr:Sua5/YciO/YrdC/YwlC family protein [Methylobacillus sp.]